MLRLKGFLSSPGSHPSTGVSNSKSSANEDERDRTGFQDKGDANEYFAQSSKSLQE